MLKPEAFELLRQVLKSLERISDTTGKLAASDEAKSTIDRSVVEIAGLCSKLSELLAESSDE